MEIAGLPLHPLVVHAAVILVPLACLGALGVVLWGRVRDRYGWLAEAFAGAAALAAVAAWLTGQDLTDRLHAAALVATHHVYGELMPYPAIALAVVLPGVLLWRRPSALGRLAGVLTVVAAVAGLVLIVLTGHSGAMAVWGGR